MSSAAAPTIAADVAVTLNDNVARELLSLGGVVEGDLPSWRLPDGTQTTDPQAALAGALRAIAAGDGASRRDAEELPAVGSTITATLPATLAVELVEYAGLEHSNEGCGWRTRDGRERTDQPRVAVTDALVAIAETDLAACPSSRPPRRLRYRGGGGPPIFARIYKRWARVAERPRIGRSSPADAGAGDGANFPYYPRTVSEVAVEPDAVSARGSTGRSEVWRQSQ